MAAGRRGPFAPAGLAGAILFLPTVLPAASTGDLDQTMQPIARDAAVPVPQKRKAVPSGDANAEPLLLRSSDRTAPEYSGDRPETSDEMPPHMDAFVDRTVNVMDSLNATTNSLLRPERP